MPSWTCHRTRIVALTRQRLRGGPQARPRRRHGRYGVEAGERGGADPNVGRGRAARAESLDSRNPSSHEVRSARHVCHKTVRHLWFRSRCTERVDGACAGRIAQPANRQRACTSPLVHSSVFVRRSRGPWPRSRLLAHRWRARAFSRPVKRCHARRCIRGWKAAGPDRFARNPARQDHARTSSGRKSCATAVFYEEMSAIPDVVCRLKRRDIDAFDAHLRPPARHRPLALRPNSSASRARVQRKPRVVGTYRLLRQEIAERYSGFYSAERIRHRAAARRHAGKRFLELGRSCVLKPYRDKRTVELLWHGIWTYVRHHRIDVMFGCASLEGTDPARLALPLSFLHHHALARPEWRAKALPRRGVAMDCMPADAINRKAGASCAAAADQGLSARRRDDRRRRRRRPPVRHRRCARDAARHRYQPALYRPFRSRRDAARRLTDLSCLQPPSPAAWSALSASR